MNSDERIWELVRLLGPQSESADLVSRVAIAKHISSNKQSWPEELALSMDEFLAEPNWSRLNALREATVRCASQWFDLEEYCRLVARLALAGGIALERAARILSGVSFASRKQLDARVSRALDVADAVCEDFDEGIMDVEHDDVFLSALRGL